MLLKEEGMSREGSCFQNRTGKKGILTSDHQTEQCKSATWFLSQQSHPIILFIHNKDFQKYCAVLFKTWILSGSISFWSFPGGPQILAMVRNFSELAGTNHFDVVRASHSTIKQGTKRRRCALCAEKFCNDLDIATFHIESFNANALSRKKQTLVQIEASQDGQLSPEILKRPDAKSLHADFIASRHQNHDLAWRYFGMRFQSRGNGWPAPGGTKARDRQKIFWIQPLFGQYPDDLKRFGFVGSWYDMGERWICSSNNCL